MVLQPSGVWCMGLLGIIKTQANLEIGNVTEVAHDSASMPGVVMKTLCDHGVVFFPVGTLTEGSVKISPIFKGIFMRFVLLDCLVRVLSLFWLRG